MFPAQTATNQNPIEISSDEESVPSLGQLAHNSVNNNVITISDDEEWVSAEEGVNSLEDETLSLSSLSLFPCIILFNRQLSFTHGLAGKLIQMAHPSSLRP